MQHEILSGLRLFESFDASLNQQYDTPDGDVVHILTELCYNVPVTRHLAFTRAGRACGHLVTRAAKRQFLLARRARSSESSRERLGDDTIHE